MNPQVTVITLGVDDGHLWEVVWNPEFASPNRK